MQKFGMKGFTEESGRLSGLWFDLVATEFYASWKGKLIVNWPPPERSWWRRAHRNNFSNLRSWTRVPWSQPCLNGTAKSSSGRSFASSRCVGNPRSR
ncbi:hypothetical protein SBA6_1100022 [Candidatus Sulfopaludibacter sp. SbA6]|nr:hypothetical protein SBA6_1100022 [Candidatus Sulfopaludibacter sp. SbA6]